MRIARWAQSRRVRRVGAVVVLGFLFYLGITQVTRIIRVDACLDAGRKYDYRADVCME